MKSTHTLEEKKQYFADLRARWKEAKALSEDPEFKNLYALCLEQCPGTKISRHSFAFVLHSMKANQFNGLPYIDCKTFQGWQQYGFKVRKGERSSINGITWLKSGKEEDPDDGFVFPKIYHLFHKSQVEAMA